MADSLPAALTSVDISSPDGAFACETSNTFPCALGNLAAGASVTIIGDQDHGLQPAAPTSTATASTTTAQSDALDLSDTETTTVACAGLDESRKP